MPGIAGRIGSRGHPGFPAGKAPFQLTLPPLPNICILMDEPWTCPALEERPPVMDNSNILIRGAREHNLRNVNLDLPRNRLIVFTGVSGSGKSSLAFDTLYAEGQRRYVESLSSYAR